MITEAQREIFAAAMEDLDAYIDPADVTATADTVKDFVAIHGQPTEKHLANGVTINFWRGMDCRSVFDLTAGNLYVVDFGDSRAAYVERGMWKTCKA